MPRARTKRVDAEETQAVERLRRNELLAAAQGRLPSEATIHHFVNKMQHGVLTNALLTEDERVIFYAMIERFEAEYDLNTSADFISTELICLLIVLAARAVKAQDWEAYGKIDSSMRSHLREMKASKRGREGEENKTVQQSPAEWAAELVQRYKQEQARLAEEDAAAARRKALPAPENGE